MKLIKSVKEFPSVISSLGWLNIEEVIQRLDLTSDGSALPEGINDPVFDSTFETVEFNHEFSVTGNIINYKLSNATKDKLLLNLNIDLDIIKSHPAYADQTLWGVKDSVLQQHKNGFVGQDAYTVKKEEFVQFMVDSYTNKEPVITSNFPVKFFVPGKDITVDDITVFMAVSDETQNKEINTVTGITNIVTTESIPGTPMWKQLISPITSTTSATTVNVGDDVVVNITTEDTKVKEVYLEPVVGITNKTRVQMTNGQGSYIVKTGDLQSGDQIRIKHGYKWFTGVSEFTKTIS